MLVVEVQHPEVPLADVDARMLQQVLRQAGLELRPHLSTATATSHSLRCAAYQDRQQSRQRDWRPSRPERLTAKAA